MIVTGLDVAILIADAVLTQARPRSLDPAQDAPTQAVLETLRAAGVALVTAQPDRPILLTHRPMED